MTSRDFCYWLQGFFEIEEACEHHPKKYIDEKQLIVIRNHLALVFKHEIDPSIDGGNQQVAQALQQIHDGKPITPGTGIGDQIYRC